MIILASTSPTRNALLHQAGVDFAIQSPNVDERLLISTHPNWSPEDIATELATAKANDVSAHYPGALVVGADQVLALGNTAYSKPRDRSECREQLCQLRGNCHQLISSVACARHGHTKWSTTQTAHLKMRRFSDEFLDRYLDDIGSECTATVGGYKVEGIGIQLFESIEGDHFAILGLPLLPLLQYLRTEKALHE